MKKHLKHYEYNNTEKLTLMEFLVIERITETSEVKTLMSESRN